MPGAVGQCDRGSQSGTAEAAVGYTRSLWGSAVLAFSRLHRLDFFFLFVCFFDEKERKDEAGDDKFHLTRQVSHSHVQQYADKIDLLWIVALEGALTQPSLQWLT